MAAVSEQILVDGNGIDVPGHVVALAVDQTGGTGAEAQGGFHLRETQFVVRGLVVSVKGNGEGGMVANAEGHLLFVVVLNGEGVVDSFALKAEGGHQAELVGPLGVSLGSIGQLQNDGILGLLHKLMLHQPGKAVLGAGVGAALGFQQILGDTARMGEQDGSVVTPDGGISVPHMLHIVILADDAADLGALGGNGQLQILVFNAVVHILFPPLTYAHNALHREVHQDQSAQYNAVHAEGGEIMLAYIFHQTADDEQAHQEGDHTADDQHADLHA